MLPKLGGGLAQHLLEAARKVELVCEAETVRHRGVCHLRILNPVARGFQMVLCPPLLRRRGKLGGLGGDLGTADRNPAAGGA